MKFSRFCMLGVLAVGSLMLVSTAFADAITGPANISGTVQVTSSAVKFFGGIGGNTPNIFDAGAPDTGSFYGLASGVIRNLTGGPAVGPTNVTDFMTFNTASGPIYFNLAYIEPGKGTLSGCKNSVGSVCTPTGSPFTLRQILPNEVEIDLGLEGIAYTGSAANGSSATMSLFTTQNLVPGTISGILHEVESRNGILDSYSATFAAAPEPASALLIGAGLLGVGLIARRKPNK